MTRNSTVAGLFLWAVTLVGGAAQAETLVSRTSDFTLSFSDTQAFSDASVVYGLSFAYGDQPAFNNPNFMLFPLSDFQNLIFQQGGGISISTSPQPPYSSPVPVSITGDGTAGFWGATYNTSLAGGLITQGSLGGLATLNFNGGGFIGGFNTLVYYIYVHILGDWTTLGTATGDLNIIGVPAGFSTPVVTYDGTYTTISTQNASYDGVNGPPAFLDFDLIGGPVSATPLPPALPLFASGLGVIGLLARRRKRKNAAVIVA